MLNKLTQKLQKKEGFTLIEILVVIGIIAVLAAIVIIAINPARQFAQARNTQRTSNVNAILNAIGQNIADNQGTFTCGGSATAIPTATSTMDASGAANTFDIYGCIVPTYMPEMVCDPQTGSACEDSANYDTQYTVKRDGTSERITVAAPDAELGESISITR